MANLTRCPAARLITLPALPLIASPAIVIVVWKVACIIRKASLDSSNGLAEFERRQRIPIEDFSICIASKEDLIISKLFWAKNSLSEMRFAT